ncbi:MAG: MG2 domain-containing protein [Candidatus Paceibacterota bacterium]
MEEKPKKEKFDVSVIQDKDSNEDAIGSPASIPKKTVLDTDSLRDYLGIQEKAKSSDPRERLSFYVSQAKEFLSQNILWQEITYFWTPKKIGLTIVFILGVFLLWGGLSYVDLQKSTMSAQYRLVPEKVSKSAAIRISIPAGVDVGDVKNKISFNPKIDGEWVNENAGLFSFAFAADNPNSIFYFKPKRDLEANRYYEILLNLGGDKKISTDFLAVDNPIVTAVFPDEKLEALEDSKITIVFNRQIVDTLSISKKQTNVPVEISPSVEGEFKWMSNTVLQFVPKNKLISSTNYEVKIKEGFVSLDGVPVPSSSFKFKTRSVRYLNESDEEEKKVIYNEPIRIYFNQPVNLEKMIKEMKLYDSQNNKIEFYAKYADATGNEDSTAEYPDGSAEKYANNEEKSENSEDYGWKALTDFISSTIKSANTIEPSQIDVSLLGKIVNEGNTKKNESVIEVYNNPSSSDRAYLWALNSDYVLEIGKAYPLHGDVSYERAKKIKIRSGDVIDTYRGVSNRTSESGLDYFDVSGALLVRFYEDIDIAKSIIGASNAIEKIDYGQKCSNSEISIYDSGCLKIPDKKSILIYFSPNGINPGEKINLTLRKIYNTDGKLINKDEISKQVTVYGNLNFDLGRVVRGSNLSTLIICSNNPLFVPDKTDFKKYISANLDYEIFSWEQSWRQSSDGENYCAKNSFVTRIGVGFMPEKDYELRLDVEDVFGQKKSETKYFRTSKMESGYVSVSSMQNNFILTLAEKTKLSFSAQNVSTIELKICKKIDGYSFYSDFKKRGKQEDNFYKDNNELDCSTVKTDTIKLPERYWIKNYFDIDIKKYFDNPIGNYVIKLSNKNFNDGKGVFSYMTVTNLAVAEKKVDINTQNNDQEFLKDLKNIYWVTDIKTQDPIRGAKVKLYSNGKIIEGETNDQGVSLISPVNNMEIAIVENGNDSTFIGFDGDSMNAAINAFSIKRSYIYTDKSNYLPGETVNIKGLLRTGYDGKYEISDSKANVYILNPKGEKVSEQEMKLDEFGAFVTSIPLGNDTSLGSYSICAADYNCGYFTVLEGSKNNLVVDITTDKSEYVSKDTLSMNVDANYYFGVPIENGVVDYTVSAKNYYFDRYASENYSFNYISDDFSDKFLFKDTARLDSNGKITIKKQIDLDALFGGEKQSKILTFDITVKDSFGQSTSTKKTMIFHSGQSYLGIALDSYFVSKKDAVGIKIISTNTEGKVREFKNIDILVNKIDWVRYGNNWEKKSENVKKMSVSTNLQGEYKSNSLKMSSEGEYELVLAGTDKNNNKIYTRATFYIYGDDGNVGVQVKDDYALNIKTNNDRLRSGNSGEVIIESPYMKAKALITIERGKIFDYRIVDVVGGFYNYKFDVKNAYAPNVYVSVLLQTSNPTVNFAMKSFNVDSDANKLFISLNSDKKSYGPGETVKLRVFTGTSGETGMPADVSLSVVGSTSLNASGSYRDPFMFFYNGFPLTVSTFSNIKTIMEKGDSDKKKTVANNANYDTPFAQSGYNDAVFWKGTVKTGNDGRADIVFKLPDSLAYWQVEAVGVTVNSKVGAAYLNFNTEKEITILSLKPKFVIPGDAFYVGAKITNQSRDKKSVKASFSSDTLVFTGSEKEVVLNIEKGDSQSVYFSVIAPKNYLNDFHKYSISIKGENVDESINQELIIMPDTTFTLSRNSNYSNENRIGEATFIPGSVLKDGGSLSVKGGTNLSIFLTDGLNSLIESPYSDIDNTVAAVRITSKVKRIFGIDNPYNKLNLTGYAYGGKESNMDSLLSEGVVKISRSQNDDGGFSLFGGDNSDKSISARVLETFGELEKTGDIESSDQRYAKLSDYAYNALSDSNTTNEEKIEIGSALVGTEKYKNDKKVKSVIGDIAKNNEILNNLSNQSLAKLAVMLNSGDYGWGLNGNVNNILDKRVVSDARGSHIGQSSEQVLGSSDNSIVNTALYLQSIAKGKRDKNTDNLIKWLLKSRSPNGSWGSAQNTMAAMDAFIDYVDWKKEANAEYYLAVNLNGSNFDGYQFNPSRIFDQMNKETGLDGLNIGSVNLIDFDKSNHRALFKDALYYDVSAKYFFSETVKSEDNGFVMTKSFYPLNSGDSSEESNSVQAGDVLRVHLEVVVPKKKNAIVIEDFIPAGMEILDMDLIADQKSLRSIEKQVKNDYLYPDRKEIKNDRAMIYKKNVEAGVYKFDYYVRALARGRYLNLQGVIWNYDNPDEYGKTASFYFEIK